MSFKDIFLQACQNSSTIVFKNIAPIYHASSPRQGIASISTEGRKTLSIQAFVDSHLSDEASEASFVERLRLAVIDDIDRVRRNMGLPRVADAIAKKARDAHGLRQQTFVSPEEMARATRALCRGI